MILSTLLDNLCKNTEKKSKHITNHVIFANSHQFSEQNNTAGLDGLRL